MATIDRDIGVGPVTVPGYLDRPQIVTRQGSDELNIADFDRWGEPLQESVPRILAEDLSALLQTDRISVFPWSISRPIAYQVVVDIARFDGVDGGAVVLEARWRIVDSADKELVLKRATLSEAIGGRGYGAVVGAMSRALGALSRDIATALAALPAR